MASAHLSPDRLGPSKPRSDAPDKCRGRAGYLDETDPAGLLFARTVRSTRPRAKLVSIDYPDLPEGYFIVDKDDVPGRLYPFMYAQDYPILADGAVGYVGEAICLVVGPDKETVYELCEQVKIEYEDLPPVLTLDDSIAAREPRIFGEDNVYIRREFERGEVDKAFAEAEQIFSDEFTTGYQEHLYLETQRVAAEWTEDRIIFHGPSQGPDPLPPFMAQIFGWEPSRFQALGTTVGGGFGGKIETPIFVSAHAGLAAHKAKASVQMIYDRPEDLATTTKRHPSRVAVQTAVDSSGDISAMDITVQLMAGAYAWFCPVVLEIAVKMASGAYRVPNLRVKGSAHATNRVMPGAMRGFGVVQTNFAVETHLSRIARRLGRDPLEFKAAQALRTGDPTCTGGELKDEVNLPQIIASIERQSGYRDKIKRYRNQTGRFRRGIGAAIYAFGAPHTVGQGPRRKARPLSVKKRADGRVEIRTNIVELGQGIRTTYRKIVSAVLDIPVDQIDMTRPDSLNNPPTLGTGASLSIVLFGKSLERAALELKERWDEAEELEIVKDFEEPERLVWDEAATKGDSFHTYSWGGLAVEVDVDTVTGQIQVLGAWSAHDIGTPIDELICQGQVDGAVVQGLGLGYLENLTGPTGHLQQTSLADYIIPTALDAPPMGREFVTSYYPDGPFGAKSVGEMPIVGGAPAVAEAVALACGVEINDAPITQEALLALIEEAES